MKPVQRCVCNFVQYQLYRYVLSNSKTIEEVVKKTCAFFSHYDFRTNYDLKVNQKESQNENNNNEVWQRF